MDNTRKEIPLALVVPSVSLPQPATSSLGTAEDQTHTNLGLSLSPVLIAVADAIQREQLAELWRQEGYSVSTMACGTDVLEQLADALLSEHYIEDGPAYTGDHHGMVRIARAMACQSPP
jgi:hypothetical protein